MTLDTEKIVNDFLGVQDSPQFAVPTPHPRAGTGNYKSEGGFIDPFVTLLDLLAEPEPELHWVVEGRLLAGGFSVFVAPPKAGKSTNACARDFASKSSKTMNATCS